MAGTFMTSLEMAGVSLSLLSIQGPGMLSALDSPTTAPAWVDPMPLTIGANGQVEAPQKVPYTPTDTVAAEAQKKDEHKVDECVYACITSACDRLVEVEPELTRCDSICGDGDCGLVMKKGAIAVKALLEKQGEFSCPSSLCEAVADAVSGSMGGTSGALIELCLRSMANFYRETEMTEGESMIVTFAQALEEGVDAIMFYGGAEPGMRTMLDALVPAVDALCENASEGGVTALVAAAAAAKGGAEKTGYMVALAGRANYVNAELMRGVPDPGAVAVKEFFETVALMIL